jgi:hypothetical protein
MPVQRTSERRDDASTQCSPALVGAAAFTKLWPVRELEQSRASHWMCDVNITSDAKIE